MSEGGACGALIPQEVHLRKGYSVLLALSILGAFTGLAIPAGASDAPATATSYINPDTGAATANPNVAPNSDCDTPDREDTAAERRRHHRSQRA